MGNFLPSVLCSASTREEIFPYRNSMPFRNPQARPSNLSKSLSIPRRTQSSLRTQGHIVKKRNQLRFFTMCPQIIHSPLLVNFRDPASVVCTGAQTCFRPAQVSPKAKQFAFGYLVPPRGIEPRITA